MDAKRHHEWADHAAAAVDDGADKITVGRVYGLFGLLLFGAMLLSGCGQELADFRQKITAEIETPAGVVSGGSVQRIVWRRNDPLSAVNGPGVHILLTGEAVVVDLGATPLGPRYLFALLKGMDSAVPDLGTGRTIEEWLQSLGQNVHPLAPVPLLVTFTDIADPASVQLVDPTNLAATFGRGYSLQSITLEITDEPVTQGRIEDLLPCVSGEKRCIPLNAGLPYGHAMRNLTNGDFRRVER